MSADVDLDLEAEGPHNNILTGKPLFVPIIDDPFTPPAETPPAEVFRQIRHVMTREPPSAADTPPPAVDAVDILEVLDIAEKKRRKRLERKAKKMAKELKAKQEAAGVAALKAKLAKDRKLSMKMVQKEMQHLDKLLAKAKKVQDAIPRKKARLELLQSKLSKAAEAETAPEKKKNDDAKAALEKAKAAEVAGKIKILAAKMKKLEKAKSLVNQSMKTLEAKLPKKKGAAKTDAKKDAKTDAKAAPAKDAKAAPAQDAKKPAFLAELEELE